MCVSDCPSVGRWFSLQSLLEHFSSYLVYFHPRAFFSSWWAAAAPEEAGKVWPGGLVISGRTPCQRKWGGNAFYFSYRSSLRSFIVCLYSPWGFVEYSLCRPKLYCSRTSLLPCFKFFSVFPLWISLLRRASLGVQEHFILLEYCNVFCFVSSGWIVYFWFYAIVDLF